MKKNLKIFLIIIFFVLILVIFFQFRSKSSSFYRVDLNDFEKNKKYFKLNKKSDKVFFKRGKIEILLKEIPTTDGYYFYLKGNRNIKIVPEYVGEIKFYTYLYFESSVKNNKIRFTLEINRKKKNTRISRIETSKASYPFFKTLKVHRKDRIVLRFKGSGIVYFSRPIIYREISAKKRKNIILIGVDTLRGDQIGLKKGNRSLTPNIDSFIKDSVYFENAYAQSSWTIPSFISLFTGLYEFNHKVDIRHSLELDKCNLVTEISKKFISFAYHGGLGLRRRWGYSRGFDFYKEFRFTGPLFPRGGQSLFHKAIELIKKSNFPDLFLFLHTYQVHDPYTPPKEFLLKINPESRFMRLDAVNQNKPKKTFLPVGDDLRKSLKELYQAEIFAFDSYFGEFILELKKMNIYDNSMIIFMSDHGEEFYEHKGWAHSHSLYNELIKVPVIIKFPKNRFEDFIVNEKIGVIDLIPTILSYNKIKYDKTKTDGINLIPVIKGETERDYLISSISTSRYIEAIPPKFAIFYDDYKLIYNYKFCKKDLEFFENYALPPKCPEIELYNYKKDINDKYNIASKNQNIVKYLMPIIIKLKKIIKQNISDSSKKKKRIDEEVREQLRTLGYIQ